jgi:hypothetical protein
MDIGAEQSLFEACLAAADAEGREALLAAHPDADVAARVRRLLALHETHPAALAAPAPPPALPPQRIGAFCILESSSAWARAASARSGWPSSSNRCGGGSR